MYANLTTLYLCPNKMDEVIHIYQQEIIPFVQRQEGCQLITLLVDPDRDQIIVIGWWESEAELQASQQETQYRQQLAQLNPILLATPLCTSYQVSLQVAPI